MRFESLAKISINSFMGLFDRGGNDQVPIDHASGLINIAFTKKGEINVRPGTNLSKTSAVPVVRQFLSTVNGVLLWLTCDGAGHIKRQDTGATFLTVANMVDFAALNIFGKTFIAPLLSAFSSTNPIYVYDGTNPPRPMQGAAPGAIFTATNSATVGNVSPGVHLFAISYVTNTGYTTIPGPVIAGVFSPVSVTATGGFKVDLSGLPLGPTGTVARQIFVTKSGLAEFFYVDLIADNTTTTATINFFDTDLVVSADSLFDQFTLTGGVGFGGMALVKYAGRMLVVQASTVYVSQVGDAETVSSITGALSIPSESDGNDCRAAAELFGVLYIMKAVGIFSTQDNGGEPNTWTITKIDGAIGSYQAGIGSISGSQSSLTMNSSLLLANRAGLWMFNGNVGRPALSYKIQDFWDRVSDDFENKIEICVDPFNDIIYANLPIDGSSTPNVLLMGDFSQGLSPDTIRWSQYSFPWDPTSISMINVDDGSDFQYQLRLGTSTNIYKLHTNYTADYNGIPIAAFYQCFGAAIGDGALNIFSYLRIRAKGSGDLHIQIANIDSQNAIFPPIFVMASLPQKELGRQINYMSEKMFVKVSVQDLNNTFTISSIDIYGKIRFAMRPNG